MIKVLLTFLLLLNILHAQEYKKIAVIPADINYNKEDAEAFAEMLYDAVLNSIAEYNFSQTNVSNMYKVMPTGSETLLAMKKYQKEIHQAHKVVAQDSEAFLQANNLQETILMDFSTKKILHTMEKCRKKCPVTISLELLTAKKKALTKKYTLQYDAHTCMIADESIESLNKNIATFLGK